MKHDRIAKEFSCGVNSLPLSFADLTGRGLDLQEKGERQKKERGGGVQKGGLMVSVEGWGGLWEKQNLLFFFQLIPYDRLIAFSAKREKRRTTKPWEIQKVKCTKHNLLTRTASTCRWEHTQLKDCLKKKKKRRKKMWTDSGQLCKLLMFRFQEPITAGQTVYIHRWLKQASLHFNGH